MPRFFYTAKKTPSEITEGYMEAASESECLNKLASEGYFPISVRQQDNPSRAQKVFSVYSAHQPELALFTRQLCALIGSGVDILNALRVISEQQGSSRLRRVVNDLQDKIRSGRSFSESLATYPEFFPEIYTALIRAGEASGKIEDILKNLADFMEKEQDFRSRVRTALIYPFFVIAVAVATLFILLGYAVPRIASVFQGMDRALPLPTQALISISGFIRSYSILIIIAAAVFIWAVAYLASSTKKGALMRDNLRLKAFFIGELTVKSDTARLARTLSLLLSSGVPITSSLDIAHSVVKNSVLKEELVNIKHNIRNGMSLSSCLRDCKFFPPLAVNIIATGEESGRLEEALSRIARDYDADVERMLAVFTRMLEPSIILVIGVVVGAIVISILLPVFQMNLFVK